jgi:hypothetical protein
MSNDDVDARQPGGVEPLQPVSGVLSRLVDELGQAARTGWGPTLRWVVLLAAMSVTAGTIVAVALVFSH